MIEIYTGTPGSGKTLHAVQDIVEGLYSGKQIITNFQVNASAMKHRKNAGYIYVQNSELKPDFLIKFGEEYKKIQKRIKEDSIILIIDEAQLIFNARSWNEKGRSEWVSFFSQHRKLGYRIILICQFKEMIDKQIRSVIEYEYLHRKIKNIGNMGKILNLLSGGNLHVMVQIYVPLNEKTSSRFYKGNTRLYRFYDSYTRF